MRSNDGLPSASDEHKVDQVVTVKAARSLEAVGDQDQPRYRFAHQLLLDHARDHRYLSHPEYRQRIHEYAAYWRDQGLAESRRRTHRHPALPVRHLPDDA